MWKPCRRPHIQPLSIKTKHTYTHIYTYIYPSGSMLIFSWAFHVSNYVPTQLYDPILGCPQKHVRVTIVFRSPPCYIYKYRVDVQFPKPWFFLVEKLVTVAIF